MVLAVEKTASRSVSVRPIPNSLGVIGTWPMTDGEEGGYGVIRPSAQEDYEEQWEQLGEKVILAQILAELQQIRMGLSDATTGDESGPTMYECQRCQTTVQAEERQRHAREQHKAPPDMAESMFTRKD